MIVPRWEWRTFARGLPAIDHLFEGERSVEESDELYLLAPDGDNVKVRDGLMDIKVLREVDPDGLQRWEPVLKAPFPLSEEAARTVFQGLRRPVADIPVGELTLDAVLDAAGVGTPGGPRALRVHKQRTRCTVVGCPAERAVFEVGGHRATSIAIESADPTLVVAAVRALDLGAYVNQDVRTGLRLLVDRAPERYAVIDSGTNSIKFHVAEQDADGQGAWRTVVDRAVVTRLGEGLSSGGAIGAEPLERTAHAVAEMADEARSLDVRAIALVGTAGLRIASNQAEVVETLASRAGLSLEVITGAEEGRLAHLAVVAGVGLGEGAIVAFDTGGGSSQFSFGHGTTVDERFSLDVGAVRFTERFGLAEAVSADTVADARAAIEAELGRLRGRPRPDEVVAMGGAVTNLAAVKHGLTTYDADVVQGTVLDRAEIDRQIELYRGLGAEERRQIAGLQPARAEVILAGACIVRTILEMLGSEQLKVSDRGLRHGVLLERFGRVGPTGT